MFNYFIFSLAFIIYFLNFKGSIAAFEYLNLGFQSNLKELSEEKKVLGLTQFLFTLDGIQCKQNSANFLLENSIMESNANDSTKKEELNLNFELRIEINQYRIIYHLFKQKDGKISQSLEKASLNVPRKENEKLLSLSLIENEKFLQLLNLFVKTINQKLDAIPFKKSDFSVTTQTENLYLDLVFVINPYIISELKINLNQFISKLKYLHYQLQSQYPYHKIRFGIIYTHFLEEDKILNLTENFQEVEAYIKENYYPIEVSFHLKDILKALNLAFYNIEWYNLKDSPKFVFLFIDENSVTNEEINYLDFLLNVNVNSKKDMNYLELYYLNNKLNINIDLYPLEINIDENSDIAEPEKLSFLKSDYQSFLGQEISDLKEILNQKIQVRVLQKAFKKKEDPLSTNQHSKFSILSTLVQKDSYYNFNLQVIDNRFKNDPVDFKIRYTLYNLSDLYLLTRFLKQQILFFLEKKMQSKFLDIKVPKDFILNFKNVANLYGISTSFVLAHQFPEKITNKLSAFTQSIKGSIINLMHTISAYKNSKFEFQNFFYKKNLLFKEKEESKDKEFLIYFSSTKKVEDFLSYSGYYLKWNEHNDFLNPIKEYIMNYVSYIKPLVEEKKTNLIIDIEAKAMNLGLNLNPQEKAKLLNLSKFSKNLVMLAPIVKLGEKEFMFNRNKILFLEKKYEKEIPQEAFIKLESVYNNVDFFAENGLTNEKFWPFKILLKNVN